MFLKSYSIYKIHSATILFCLVQDSDYTNIAARISVRAIVIHVYRFLHDCCHATMRRVRRCKIFFLILTHAFSRLHFVTYCYCLKLVSLCIMFCATCIIFILPILLNKYWFNRTKAVTQHFLENSFKKLSIKRKQKQKNPKNTKIYVF